MELFTATGKLKKFFLTTGEVRCVHHGWHGSHRYDIQVLATHASTRHAPDNFGQCNESPVLTEYRVSCAPNRVSHFLPLFLTLFLLSLFLLFSFTLLFYLFFDVITSLVSLEHGVYICEKVTSQRILALERSGVTSLRDISIVGMHVIRCHSNGTVRPLWVQRPRRGNIWTKHIHTTTIIGE
jgi:hypothetical protein